METLFKCEQTNERLNQYIMRRYEIIVPLVDNDGNASDYLPLMREALQVHEITGWTECDTFGYWYGKREAGVMIIIYRETESLDTLCKIARECMPDQNAIQVCVSGDLSLLVEA